MSSVAQPGDDDDITSALLDQPNRNPNKEPQGREPILDLPDDSPVNTTSPFTTPSTTPTPITAAPAGRWMFLNGKWVQVMSPTGGSSGLPEGGDPLAGAQSLDELVTQRVIKVPVKPLLQGAASYNIVVRPGDIIHVPPPEQGFVYADGPGISQAGVYQLPTAGQLTLRRLVASAGGLSQLANANRVDLTRRIGEDRQAIIRLDLKAIAEGTQPDIVLKADDLVVTFGTDFWATPLPCFKEAASEPLTASGSSSTGTSATTSSGPRPSIASETNYNLCGRSERIARGDRVTQHRFRDEPHWSMVVVPAV
ncbi:MAG: hypothetical protein R3B46_05640 [Phycisphaerales bacterium]